MRKTVKSYVFCYDSIAYFEFVIFVNTLSFCYNNTAYLLHVIITLFNNYVADNFCSENLLDLLCKSQNQKSEVGGTFMLFIFSRLMIFFCSYYESFANDITFISFFNLFTLLLGVHFF